MLHRLILPLGLGLFAVIAGFLASTFFAQNRGEPVWQAATVLPESRPVPAITLLDQSGEIFEWDGLKGDWHLVFMGFSHCGNVCPATLYELVQIAAELPDPPGLVFVSVDPQRDSPDVLRAYVQQFDPGMLGLTGLPGTEDLAILAGSLGVDYRVISTGGAYSVDHSSAVFLLDPDASFKALFSAPLNREAIVADLRVLLD